MFDPETIWTSSKLPTLPTVAVRLLEQSKNSRTEINDVVEIIKSDPAISARILKSANSSVFGFRYEIASIDRAVPLLGTAVVTSLALGFCLIDDSMMRGPVAEHYQTYWLQSVIQAAAAETLSDLTGVSERSECFQAGLLIDIGRLAMLKTLGNDYVAVLLSVADDQRAVLDAEEEMLGFTHSEIGIKLAESWKLPLLLQKSIELHHAPLSRLLKNENTPEFPLLQVTSVAAAVGDYYCDGDKGAALQRMQNLTEEFFGYSDSDLRPFLETVENRIVAFAQLFKIDTEQIPSAKVLLAEANEQLSELALNAQMEQALASQRQFAAEQENAALQSQNVELEKKAFFDPLTEVYNRHFFDEAFARVICGCQRTNTPIALIFADIDRFKNINDTCGHQFGDVVLRQTAQVLARTVRECDVLARYGGEEFIILVHNPTDEAAATALAERLRRNVEAETVTLDGQSASVTISLGVVTALPEVGEPSFAEYLIAEADKAMYEAKQNGRNQHVFRAMLNRHRSPTVSSSEALPLESGFR